MDKLNTHSVASLYEAFPPEEARRGAERLEVHHAPKHGSWLNMAKVELSALSRDLPDHIGDRTAMACHLGAWKGRRNGAGVKADGQSTTVDARTKLRKLQLTT